MTFSTLPNQKKITSFWIVLLFVFLQKINGQEPGMWHITDEDGLPSMTVYQITQDDQGYIWMGTERGVCRFDGNNFKYYKSSELKDNEILKVKTDAFNRIWFKNLSGQLFYIENEKIHNAEVLLKKKLPFVFDFIVEKYTIWLSLKKDEKYFISRIKFDEQEDEFSLDNYSPYFSDILPASYSENELYILGKELGIYKIFSLDEDSEHLTKKQSFSPEIIKKINQIHFYKDQIFFLSNRNENTLILKNDETGIHNYFNFEGGNTINNLAFIDESIWILTNNGVFVQSLLNDDVSTPNHFLSNTSSNHLMCDKEGNKWISTTGGGVYVINAPQTNIFRTSNSQLPSNEVYSLEYDPIKKQLIVGHDNGLVSIIDKNLKSQKISLKTSGRNLDVLASDQGAFWIANDRGLFFLNKDRNISTKLSVALKKILRTKNGDLWVCSYSSIYKINEDFITISGTGIESLTLMLNERGYALAEDFYGNIWMGTIHGIYIYQDTEILPFLENGRHVQYNIATILQAKDSIIWVGTRGDGLLGIYKNEIKYRFKEADGLASNVVKCLSVAEDALWIGTDNGLNKLDFKTDKWEWINTIDGLPSNEITDIEIVDNEIWIGTPKGLVNFSVNAKHTNENPPPIYIKGIKLEDWDTLVKDSFLLPYNKNSIQIDFLGIALRGKGDLTYQYKLWGVDDDWVISTSDFTRYPNLPSGDYHFEVFALNEDEIKSEKPATVFFSIRPPWWQTWWFITLGTLTIIGIVSYLVNVRIQKQKREREFSRQVSELKTMALRSQMNPHFIFNALNAIQKFLSTNNREQAMHYLSRFGKLIRLIFEQSQKETISLEDELEFLNIYLDLEKLRFMDRVDIQMKIDSDLQNISDEINIPPLLIQPIIENSFKHGFLYKKEQGILKINFYQKDTFLVCTIEDNGIGRKKAAELGQTGLKDRSSSGLKTARERLLINNAKIDNLAETSGINITDLYHEDGQVKGTLVKVNIHCIDF